MDFRSASPSIVRSVEQRDLLNAWLRAFDRRVPLPASKITGPIASSTNWRT
jgi:hypothetical protein